MRVLIVSSYNNHCFAPFITEQVDALRVAGCDVEYFGVTGKGIKGYLRSFPALKTKIQEWTPDVIHAHYGLSGLLANMQRNVPVVTTYHGSDINLKKVRPFSRVSLLLSKHNIFVSRKTLSIINPRKRFSLIPCGVDLTDIQKTSKSEARERMNLASGKKYVLFPSAFDNQVKNYPLAKAVMSLVSDAELLELKGYARGEVSLIMCAVDCLLMTSYSEGSPQVIKEAMACGLPIVSVDVGDVKEITAGIEGCYICSRNPNTLASFVEKSFNVQRTDGRERIAGSGLTNDGIAQRLMSIYNGIVENR